MIRGRGGYSVYLTDRDLQDPYGGELGLYGIGLSGDGSNDSPLEFSTALQAGDRYRLSVTTETDWSILRNPPVTRSGTVQGEFTFTLTIPDPTPAAGVGGGALLLLFRRPRSQ